jgi:hypothetical protein
MDFRFRARLYKWLTQQGIDVVVAIFEVEPLISVRAYQETEKGKSVIIFSTDSDFYVYLGLLFDKKQVVGNLHIMKSALSIFHSRKEHYVPIVSGEQISSWFLNQTGIDIARVAGIVGSDYSYGGFSKIGFPTLEKRLEGTTLIDFIDRWADSSEKMNVIEGVHGYISHPLSVVDGIVSTFGHFLSFSDASIVASLTSPKLDYFPLVPSDLEVQSMTKYCFSIGFEFTFDIFDFRLLDVSKMTWTFQCDPIVKVLLGTQKPQDDFVPDDPTPSSTSKVIYSSDEFAYPGEFNLGEIDLRYDRAKNGKFSSAYAVRHREPSKIIPGISWTLNNAKLKDLNVTDLLHNKKAQLIKTRYDGKVGKRSVPKVSQISTTLPIYGNSNLATTLLFKLFATTKHYESVCVRQLNKELARQNGLDIYEKIYEVNPANLFLGNNPQPERITIQDWRKFKETRFVLSTFGRRLKDSWIRSAPKLKKTTMSKKGEYPSIQIQKKHFKTSISLVRDSWYKLKIIPTTAWKTWIDNGEVSYYCEFKSGFLGSEAIDWNDNRVYHDVTLTKRGNKYFVQIPYKVGPVGEIVDQKYGDSFTESLLELEEVNLPMDDLVNASLNELEEIEPPSYSMELKYHPDQSLNVTKAKFKTDLKNVFQSEPKFYMEAHRILPEQYTKDLLDIDTFRQLVGKSPNRLDAKNNGSLLLYSILPSYTELNGITLKTTQKHAYETLRAWAFTNSVPFPLRIPNSKDALIPPKVLSLDSMEVQKHDFGAFDSNVDPVQVIVSETGDVVTIGTQADTSRIIRLQERIANLCSVNDRRKNFKKIRLIDDTAGNNLLTIVLNPIETTIQGRSRQKIKNLKIGKNTTKIVRKTRILRKKLINMIDSAQEVVTNMVIKNYKVIILPHADVMSWISTKRKSQLSKKSKKLISTNRMCTFENKLIKKMELMSIRLQKKNIDFGFVRPKDINSTHVCSGCQQYNHTLQKFSREFTCPGKDPKCPILMEFQGQIHRDVNPCVNLIFWNCIAIKLQNYDAVNIVTDSPIALTEECRRMFFNQEENSMLYQKETRITTDHRPLILGSGFLNLGNYCYINSILQCLYCTSDLVEFYLNPSINDLFSYDNRWGSGGVISIALASLFWEKRHGNNQPIDPTSFKECIGSFNAAFKTNQQQDSQEFLNFLLDQLHQDLNFGRAEEHFEQIVLRQDDDEDEQDFMVRQLQQRNIINTATFILDRFEGILKDSVTCFTCSKVKCN